MIGAVVAAAALAVPASASAEVATTPLPAGQREVLLVGNNWDGTVDVIDVPSYERIRRLSSVPDRYERLAEIMADPTKLPFYLFVRTQVGEGNDQLVDDMYA